MKHYKMIPLNVKVREEIKVMQERLVNAFGRGEIDVHDYEAEVAKLEKKRSRKFANLLYVAAFLAMVIGAPTVDAAKHHMIHLPKIIRH